MNYYNELLNYKNILLICPSSYKKNVIKYLNQKKIIADISFMTFNEYKKNYCFDYDYKAIKYLTDNRNISVENAKEILENLYYIDQNNIYNNDILDNLVEIKKTLIKNDLLIFNHLFNKYINNKNIIVAGYGLLKEDKNLLKDALYLNEERKDKKYIINIFNNIEDEVEYLYNSIFDLLNDEIDINDIKVTNITNEYYPYLKRYNQYYPFKIQIKNNDSLIGTELAKTFIDDIDKYDKEEIYNKLIKNDDDNSSKLIEILNKYAKENIKEIKELIIHDLKNTKIKNTKYKNVIESVDVNDEFINEHVFLLGFNEMIPSLKNDNEYIADNIRYLINKATTEEENKLIKENLITHLSNINNLYISYNKQTAFTKHDLSILFNEDEYILNYPNNKYEYSKELNKLKYNLMLDDLKKYNIQDKEVLAKLHNEFKHNDYDSFDNSFKGLLKDQIDSIKPIKLSYTSMNEFYKCNFAYYLDRILKINENEDTLALKIGDISHAVLEKIYDDDFDFNNEWNNAIEAYIENKNIIFKDEMEEYFILKAKEDLYEAIQLIRQQDKKSKFKIHEQELEVNKKINDNLSFTGKIDKLNKTNEKEKIVSIIDYKTGNSSELKKELMTFGLSLQIPTYLYLLNNINEYKDAKIAGFYLQHISNKLHNYIEDKTINDQKIDDLKLDGYSSNNLNRLLNIEDDLNIKNKSEIIKSLAIKKDGDFSSSSKVLSDEELKDLINLVDNKIKEAGLAILSGDFKINPKIINGENKSCLYCPYSDICYRKVKDNQYLSTKENE